MSKAKRQHFVPQFYLKHFGDPLFIYDKWTGRTFKTPIDNIAFGKYFHELEGLEDGSIEEFLSGIESKCSRAYQELLEKREVKKLSPESFTYFFLFVGLQFVRTDQYRLELEDVSSQALTLFAKKSGFKLPDHIKIRYDSETIKAMHLLTILENPPQFADIFASKTWILRENHQEIPFWTSDNPITLHNTLDFGPFMGNLGLLSKGIEIHIPLTSNLRLISFDSTTHQLRKDKVGGMLERLSVIHENMLQVKSSSRFIYASSDNDFERAQNFLSKHSELKDPYRRRQQVY